MSVVTLVRDLATQGQRLTRGVNGQIKQYTGRRSAALIDDAARLAGNHRWTTLALAALALYALYALFVLLA